MTTLRKSAFPIHPEAHEKSNHELDLLMGMQLRDYFAAKVLAAFLAGTEQARHDSAKNMANTAYHYADAMIAARESQ